MKTRVQTKISQPRKAFHLAILFFFFLTQSACTGLLSGIMGGILGGGVSSVLQAVTTAAAPSSPSSPGSAGGNTGTTGGVAPSGATGDDDDDDSVIDTGDDDDDSVLPQASIPLPPGLQNSSLSAVSTDGDATAQGNLGAENAAYSLVISRVPLVLIDGTAKANDFMPKLSIAYASTEECPEGDYVVCTDIEDDGSYETTVSGIDDSATLYYYFYDPSSGELSETTVETPNQNLVYVGSDLQTVTSDGESNLYGLSDEGKFVKIAYEDASLRVAGDSADGYEYADIGIPGSQIVYNADSSTFVVLSEGSAVEFDGTTFEEKSDSDSVCDPVSGCNAKLLKLRDNQLYYGAKYSSTDVLEARIYEYGVSSVGLEFMPFDYRMSDTGEHSNAKDTQGYDVYTDSLSGFKTSVSVLKTQDDKIRLFGKIDYPSADYPTKDLPLGPSYTEIFDLMILDQQNDDEPTTSEEINDGRGIFLSNVGLTFFDFDLVQYADEASGFVLGPDINISNATQFAVSSDKSTAYVLSSSDDSTTTDDLITVVNLTDETLKTDVGTDGVLKLTDYLDGKTATDLGPKSITFFSQEGHDFLLVTLDNDDDAFKNTAIVIRIEL